MPAHRVRFLPEGREVAVEEGSTLLDAARAAGVYVGAVCGGEGTCGKCRLVMKSGEVERQATEHVSREDEARGYVLACRTRPAGDVVVEVPPESRLSGYREIEASSSERYRDFAGAAGAPQAGDEADRVALVTRRFVEVPPPTADDATADLERVLDAAAGAFGVPKGAVTAGIDVARELPRALRSLAVRGTSWKWAWEGGVTATALALERHEGSVAAAELLHVEPGDRSARSFGLALDIGTTTVVVHLVDLALGRTLEAAAKYNSQVSFGADVISRINFARSPGGARRLNEAVVADVNTLLSDVLARAGVSADQVFSAVVAGNTVMLHLFLGLEADPIRLAPFVPAAFSPAPARARDLGLAVNPRALVFAVPMTGAYVGGDITAGILASGMHRAEEVSLLVDVGTNGEVVLGSREFLVACSASAGPAFEGGSVKCGMRASPGAIDSVRISPSLEVETTTIGGAPPIGLCGTGLVDALAWMFLSGIVDRSGNLHPDRARERFRISEEDGRPEFVLAEAGDGGREVVIAQSDVDNLVRTKGAIYAAVDSLVTSVGLSFGDLARVHIAGAFGNRLDIGSCVAIGLLPDLPRDRVRFIGNSSLAGAKACLLSRAAWREVAHVRDSVTYQELMVDPAYMEKFTSACFLPHTDLARFPSVGRALAGRGRESG